VSRFAAALAIFALLVSAPVRADDVAEAKARFKKGAELYRAGKWRDAIAEFEAAYRLKPAGAIHFNVAQCRERLSEWPGALRAYHDYLREVPDAKDRAAVRASIGRIETRLAAAGVQALLVYSDPPGAAVSLDGRARGTTPFHIVLPPGTYALSLSLDGYEPVKEDVALPAAASRAVDVVLRPAAASPSPPVAAAPASPPSRAAPPAPAAGAQPPDLRAKPPAPSPLATSAPAPKPAEKRRVYTWIAAGTAVAAVAAGGWFGWSARKDENAIHSSAPPAGATPDQLTAYQRDLTQRTSDARSKARTANVLYAAGGAAAAAGVTLFFVEKRF
jgi:PEGA domain-containing protein